jgi:hypothetical protein
VMKDEIESWQVYAVGVPIVSGFPVMRKMEVVCQQLKKFHSDT